MEKCPKCDRLYPGTIAHYCPSSNRHEIISELQTIVVTPEPVFFTEEKVFKESCSDGGCMPITMPVVETQTPARGVSVYLSGPMTGLPNVNKDEFNKYAEKYRQKGYDVINPAEIDSDNGRPYEYYIVKALETFSNKNLTKVYFLPGWENSRGAKLEHHIAKVLGIKRYNADTGEEMNDSKEREVFTGGAVREPGVVGSKTARYDLITPIGLRRLAETYGEGAVKYSDNNWKKGIPSANLINHVLAHIYSYLAGDRTEDHMGHAAWGIFAVMHFEELIDGAVDNNNSNS